MNHENAMTQKKSKEKKPKEAAKLGSIFRYPGGKTRKSVRDWIMSNAPDHYTEYREPFVGGGGIFFGIDQSKKRWINDKNEGLIAVYKALKERPDEFIAACREIKPMSKDEPKAAARSDSKHARAKGQALYNARLKKSFDFYAFNEECDQALRYYFINRTVWAGRVVYEQKSRMYYSNPQGWNITATDALDNAAQCLAKVKITNRDYSKVLEAPGEDVWIYCDPPYVVNTTLSNNSRLYRDNFEYEDHKRFAEAIKDCPHKVAVSYDEHEMVRDLFSDPKFKFYTKSWAYSGTAADESQLAEGEEKKVKQRGKELLITNY